MHPIQPFKFIYLFGIIALSLVAQPSFAESFDQTTRDKVKKIVMMLNIAAKEFQEGVSDGMVVIEPEYKESKIFLEQAAERYSRTSGEIENQEKATRINRHFSELSIMIEKKVDSQKVWEKVNHLNSQLITIFGIKINKVPVTPISLTNGKKIFEINCAKCHGLTGNGDGPEAKNHNPSPAVLSNPKLTGDKNTVAYDNFEVINVGIANTAMKSWTGILSEAQIWDVTYYLRTFSNTNVQLPPANLEMGEKSGYEKPDQIVNKIRNLLAKSLNKFKNGENEEAADIAFDAYLTYEKIEPSIITRDKPLGLKLESAFGRYRGAIKEAAPLDNVEKIQSEIYLDLSKALELVKNEVSFSGLFIQSFSIIVREGFETILIIAALISFLRKSKNDAHVKNIHIGVIVGILASFFTAYAVHEVLKLNMASQELLEGWIMLVSVVILFSVSYWLVSNIDNKKWQQYINKKMHGALSQGNTFALSAVAFISVYREGFETVLFYKALFLYAGETTGGILPGFLTGCVMLAGIFYLVNYLGMRIPIKWFFGFTSVLLYYMAFTFLGRGIHELQMGEQFSMTAA